MCDSVLQCFNTGFTHVCACVCVCYFVNVLRFCVVSIYCSNALLVGHDVFVRVFVFSPAEINRFYNGWMAVTEHAHSLSRLGYR